MSTTNNNLEESASTTTLPFKDEDKKENQIKKNLNLQLMKKTI